MPRPSSGGLPAVRLRPRAVGGGLGGAAAGQGREQLVAGLGGVGQAGEAEALEDQGAQARQALPELAPEQAGRQAGRRAVSGQVLAIEMWGLRPRVY